MNRQLTDLLPTDIDTALKYAIAICKAVQKLHQNKQTATTISLANLTLTDAGSIEIDGKDILIPEDAETQALYSAKNIADLSTTITDLFTIYPAHNIHVQDIKEITTHMLYALKNNHDNHNLLNFTIRALLSEYLSIYYNHHKEYSSMDLHYALESLSLFVSSEEHIENTAKTELQAIIDAMSQPLSVAKFRQYKNRFSQIITQTRLSHLQEIKFIRNIFNEHYDMLYNNTPHTKAAIKDFNRSRKLTAPTDGDGKLKSQLNEKHITEIVKAIHAWKAVHPGQNKFIVEINAAEKIKILDTKTDSDAADSKVFSVIEATDGKLYAMHQLLGNGTQGKVKMMQKLQPNDDGEYPFAPVKIMASSTTDMMPLAVERKLNFTLGKLERNKKKYLIMKFVPGHNMFEELYKLKKQTDEYDIYTANYISIYKKIMMAIGAANEVMRLHQLNILHRDIKPFNLMFDSKTNTTTIIDLDLSVAISNPSQVVRDGIVCTDGYDAPEANISNIAKNKLTYSTQSDIYALGITILNIFRDHTADDRRLLNMDMLRDLMHIGYKMTVSNAAQRLPIKEGLHQLYKGYLDLYYNNLIPKTESQDSLHRMAIDALIKQTMLTLQIASEKYRYKSYRKFFTQIFEAIEKMQPITTTNIERFNADILTMIDELNTNFAQGTLAWLVGMTDQTKQLQLLLSNMLNEVNKIVPKLQDETPTMASLATPKDSPMSVMFGHDVAPSPRESLEDDPMPKSKPKKT